MAPVLRQIYDQMADPKWVISMGDCASCTGIFNNYALIQGVDEVVPVDVYLAGCPPRAEALMDAFMALHAKIQREKLTGKKEAPIQVSDVIRPETIQIQDK